MNDILGRPILNGHFVAAAKTDRIAARLIIGKVINVKPTLITIETQYDVGGWRGKCNKVQIRQSCKHNFPLQRILILDSYGINLITTGQFTVK